MEENNNKIQQEEMVLNELEYQIKNNYFYDKEQLFNYMLSLRQNGVSLLDSKKIREFLNLYDELNYTRENNIENQHLHSQTKPKVRVRKREFHDNRGNAAFTKISFLIINIVTFALLVTMILLLNK